MELIKFKALFLALIIVTGIVMTSGCIDEHSLSEDIQNFIGVNQPLPSSSDENYTNVNESTQNQTQQNTQGTDDNQDTQTTTKKSTQTSTSTKKTTTTTPSTPAACSHPGITTKYVGLDKATGKIIYDTYCSKCGEYMGRTLY